MKKYINGQYVEMTQEEIKQMQEKQSEQEYNHMCSLSYDELINEKIRKRYSESQEFAILRQKDEKPEEYQTYYGYCEECKREVKEMKN